MKKNVKNQNEKTIKKTTRNMLKVAIGAFALVSLSAMVGCDTTNSSTSKSTNNEAAQTSTDNTQKDDTKKEEAKSSKKTEDELRAEKGITDSCELKIDLNLDGTMETIKFEQTKAGDSRVYVNGEKLEDCGEYGFCVIDVDTSDNYKELGLYDDPGSSGCTNFYRYDGKKFTKLGQLNGEININNVDVNEKVINYKGGESILSSEIMTKKKVKVDDKGFSQIQSEWEEVVDNKEMTNVTDIKSDIAIYSEADSKGKFDVLKKGESFKITAIKSATKKDDTNEDRWVKIQTKDGKEGYLRIRINKDFDNNTIDVEFCTIFDGKEWIGQSKVYPAWIYVG